MTDVYESYVSRSPCRGCRGRSVRLQTLVGPKGVQIVPVCTTCGLVRAEDGGERDGIRQG